jgi:hypothetical protein
VAVVLVGQLAPLHRADLVVAAAIQVDLAERLLDKVIQVAVLTVLVYQGREVVALDLLELPEYPAQAVQAARHILHFFNLQSLVST